MALEHIVECSSMANESEESKKACMEESGCEERGVSEASFVSLKEELNGVRKELNAKDEEIERLSRIRVDVQAELEDLTASLFEEAHRMVREANVKQAAAERALNEANMKIDVLQTEVTALKTLVLTSTPAQPNRHLHPQIDPKANKEQLKMHRREMSGGDQVDQCGSSPSSSSILSSSSWSSSSSNETLAQAPQVDPVFRRAYIAWQKSPTLELPHSCLMSEEMRIESDDGISFFLSTLMTTDIRPCLSFPNGELSTRLLSAVMSESVYLAPITDTFASLPRDCALLEAPVRPKFIMRLESERTEECFHISQLARNRVAAVCDCVNYLRYITRGLVKADVNHVYWHLMHLRRSMHHARLGFVDEH